MWHLIDHGADLAVPDLSTYVVFINLTAGTLFDLIRPETSYAKADSVTTRAAGGLPQD